MLLRVQRARESFVSLRKEDPMKRKVYCASSLFLAGFVVACSASQSAPDDSSSTSQAVTGSCATPVIVDQSLFVAAVDGQGNPNPHGVAALKDFSFQSVMNQIVATGAPGSTQTALELYDQMVDTLNQPPGDTSGPHCTGTINGFAADCPRPEGALATTNPFKSGSDGMVPVALVNRFDLAPANGANCGEYRIVFAIPTPAQPVSRFLMIFEATLPNPSPSQGLAACLPVAQFWDNLSASGITNAQFASKLKSFYFTGIPGLAGNPPFPPVIQAQNYGIGGPKNTNTGQIRINMLAFPDVGEDSQWQLRELTLSQACTGSVCTLTANNTFDKNNPFGGLFQNGAGANFQTEFIGQVKSLSATTIPLISMKTPNVDNGGQSSEQDDTNDYACQAGAGNAAGDFSCSKEAKNTTLESAIQTQLTALGNTTLTPTDIIQRATTQSCAGCHQLSPGTSLGGGLTWPASEGFTQVNEEGAQSSALTNFFLPFRSSVLTKFINKHCSGGGEDAGAESEDETVGGQAVGSAN
jgi:hypothetical protein